MSGKGSPRASEQGIDVRPRVDSNILLLLHPRPSFIRSRTREGIALVVLGALYDDERFIYLHEHETCG